MSTKKATRVPAKRSKAVTPGIAIVGPTRLISDADFLSGADVGGGYTYDVPQPFANHPWVYAGIRAISQNISGVPLLVTGGKGANLQVFSDEDNSPGGKLAAVLSKPNQNLTGFQLLETTVALMNLEGTAFWILDREDITQVPTAIYVFNKKNFNAIVNKRQEILGWVYKNDDGTLLPLSLAQVLMFKFFNPYSSIWGLAPIEAARRGIKLDVLTSIYGQAFFENNADPSGVISSEKKLSKKQMDEILEVWNTRHRGVGNAKKVGILYGGMTWQNISVSQKDMEFMEQKKWSRDEVLAVLKVPKSEMSLFEDVNYATALSQDKGFWQKTLIPIMNNIQAVFKAHLVPGLRPLVDPNLRIFFDLAQVSALQPDFDAQVTNAEKLFRIGFTCNQINERLKLGMPNNPWGDIWYVNGAVVPVDMLREVAAAKAKPSGLTTPGPDGQPPSSEDNNEDKGLFSKNLCDSHRFLENGDFQKLQSLASKLKETLRAYFRRLRAHQLALTYAANGAITGVSVFSENEWNDRLGKRVSPVYAQIVSAISRMLAKEPIEVDFSKVFLLNKVLKDRIVTQLSTSAAKDENGEAAMNRVRAVFNDVSSHSKLMAISHLEVGRVIKLQERA